LGWKTKEGRRLIKTSLQGEGLTLGKRVLFQLRNFIGGKIKKRRN